MKSVNAPLARHDAWDIRCGVFWVNDQEIFVDSDADLERKAAAFRELGCNWVMTFGSAHFRWSFYHYWDQLNAALARVVNACHHNGLRVIEHHSAVLTHAPKDAAGWAWLDRALKIRKSSVQTWPELIGGYDRNPEILDGRRLTDFYYIDGRTGKPLFTGYHGYAICPNNPYYRRAYMQYLETVYATGVNGIMTDDVGYSFYACACEFCRRDFAAQTGHELPPPGAAFDKWHGNWTEPSFRAFIDFRRGVIENYHLAIKHHYESLGLQLYRPNYERLGLQQHRDAYCLQNLPALDLIWQEAGGAHILDYSWPPWAVEAAQRFAIGRSRGIPSALFAYPTRTNQLKLVWALAMSWGQAFTGTGEGYVAMDGERRLRDFEIKHAGRLRRVRKFAALAFYDSILNRNNCFEYEKGQRDRLLGWALTCMMGNIPFDILETGELRRRMDFYRLIILREIRFMADWELEVFRQFMLEGGTMIWAGDTAAKRPDWTDRPAADIESLLGLPAFAFPADDAPPARYAVGAGRLLVCGRNYLTPDYEREHSLNWWNTDLAQKPTVPFQRLPDRDRHIRGQLAGFLRELTPGQIPLTAENVPGGVLVTGFLAEKAEAVIIHVVNTAGILDQPDGKAVGLENFDAIPFPSHAGHPPFAITIQPPPDAALPPVPQAVYFDPDAATDGVLLTVAPGPGATIRLSIPAELLGAYGMVVVQ